MTDGHERRVRGQDFLLTFSVLCETIEQLFSVCYSLSVKAEFGQFFRIFL